MPRVIDLAEINAHALASTITPAECADELAAIGFDPRNEESLLKGAALLEAMGRNQNFLGDHLVQGLAGGALAEEDNAYSAQAIMLSQPHEGVFLRANIWPAESDACFRRSGGGHNFSYGAPHDHNFDFLTYGYFGPGYWSDYYEYSHDEVLGYVGEQVALRFCERSKLDQGKLMHYRAHLDVHTQLPPDAMSVSLNIMAQDAAQGWMNQYGFDMQNGTISGQMNVGSAEVFLRTAVALGGEEAMDLAAIWGKSHPLDRVRLMSFEARADMATSSEERDSIWQEAERSGSLLVAHCAGERRALLV